MEALANPLPTLSTSLANGTHLTSHNILSAHEFTGHGPPAPSVKIGAPWGNIETSVCTQCVFRKQLLHESGGEGWLDIVTKSLASTLQLEGPEAADLNQTYFYL